MGKTVVEDYKTRGDYFVMNVDDLEIITDRADPAFEPRAELPLDHPKMVYLMESIAETASRDPQRCGNLTEILIRKNGRNSNGKLIYQVIDGRQRVKVTREINKRNTEAGAESVYLRAKHLSVQEERDFLRIMVTRNECRIGSAPSILAQQIERMIETGNTWKEAERAFAKPEAKLRELMTLTKLCDDVNKAVDAGKISVAAAGKFEDMSVQAQRTALRELLESGEKITPKRAAEKARVTPCADGGLPPPKVKPPRLKTRREIEARIAEVQRCEEGGDVEKAIFISALNWVMGVAPQEE